VRGAPTAAPARADLGTHARGKDAVATVVVDKLRRRMRQNGYRAHLTLQARRPPALGVDRVRVP
jgi:hypothetical protein